MVVELQFAFRRERRHDGPAIYEEKFLRRLKPRISQQGGTRQSNEMTKEIAVSDYFRARSLEKFRKTVPWNLNAPQLSLHRRLLSALPRGFDGDDRPPENFRRKSYRCFP